MDRRVERVPIRIHSIRTGEDRPNLRLLIGGKTERGSLRFSIRRSLNNIKSWVGRLRGKSRCNGAHDPEYKCGSPRCRVNRIQVFSISRKEGSKLTQIKFDVLKGLKRAS